jgi:hypothetical protein
LSYLGLAYKEDGRFHREQAATTLSEAEARTGRLRAQLSARGAHADVIAACKKELLADDCFHAVLEGAKSVAEKLRARSGLVSDGAPLVNEALAGSTPVGSLNSVTLFL